MNDCRFVSLFSGAMGLDLGLEMAGFHAAVCVENDPEAINTITLNRPALPILGDIRDVCGEDIGALVALAQPIFLLWSVALPAKRSAYLAIAKASQTQGDCYSLSFCG